MLYFLQLTYLILYLTYLLIWHDITGVPNRKDQITKFNSIEILWHHKVSIILPVNIH